MKRHGHHNKKNSYLVPFILLTIWPLYTTNGTARCAQKSPTLLQAEIESSFNQLTSTDKQVCMNDDLSAYKTYARWWHYGHKPQGGQKIADAQAQKKQKRQCIWRERHMTNKAKKAERKDAREQKRNSYLEKRNARRQHQQKGA